MKLQLKRSNQLDAGEAKPPIKDQVEYGELCVNYNSTDPALFIKDSVNNIIRIAGFGAVGSGKTPIGNSFPNSPSLGDVFFNSSNKTLYYYNGTEWVAIKGDDAYVDVSGDNMTGDLTLNTDKIKLIASSGNGSFAGKVTSASTISSDGATTLPCKPGEICDADGNRCVDACPATPAEY